MSTALLRSLIRRVGARAARRSPAVAAHFPRPFPGGFVDGVTLDECGLVRVEGWASGPVPPVTLHLGGSDAPALPLAAYRTYRPDAAGSVAQSDPYLGFVVEFLLRPRGRSTYGSRAG